MLQMPNTVLNRTLKFSRKSIVLLFIWLKWIQIRTPDPQHRCNNYLVADTFVQTKESLCKNRKFWRKKKPTPFWTRGRDRRAYLGPLNDSGRPWGVVWPHDQFQVVNSSAPLLHTTSSLQCCGSGMLIPDPDFYPSRIWGEERFVVIPFFVATNFTKL